MSFKKEEAQPLVQQALEAVDDMNNALALCNDVRGRHCLLSRVPVILQTSAAQQLRRLLSV